MLEVSFRVIGWCGFVLISNLLTFSFFQNSSFTSKTPPSPIYIFIIYTPNLGMAIAVSVREREQGRFRGAPREQGGAPREHEGAS